MKLIYGRSLQVIGVGILALLCFRTPPAWPIWLIVSAALCLVGHHMVKFQKVMLHMAARAGNIDAIRELLQAGYPVNKKRDNGFTALHWAVVNQHVEAVRILLSGGASPTIEDNVGRTPLSYAEEIGNAEIMQLLNNTSAEQEIT